MNQFSSTRTTALYISAQIKLKKLLFSMSAKVFKFKPVSFFSYKGLSRWYFIDQQLPES